MVYISSNGTVSKQRTWLRLSLITDALWSIVNIANVFLSTLMPRARVDRHADALARRNRYGGGSRGSSSGGSGGGSGGGERPKGPNKIHGIRPQGEAAACASAGG